MKIPLLGRVRDALDVLITANSRTEEVQQGVIEGAGFRTTGRVITPSFATEMNYYLSDPHVRAHIDDLAESTVGHGFHLEAKDKDVLEFAKDWCHETRLDEKNLRMAIELWTTGNTVLEKVDPNNLQRLVHLPISSFKRLKFSDKKGAVTSFVQRIQGIEHDLPYNKLVHLAWNRVDESYLGRGLLHTLVSQGVGYSWKDANGRSHTDHRPSYLSLKEEVEDAMRKTVVKNVPRFIHKFKGVPDAAVISHGQKIRAIRPDDDLTVGVPKGKDSDYELIRQQIDPRSRLHPFFQHLINGVYTGLETPSPKLFLEAGFTEASAKVAVEVKNQKVAAMRRFMKRGIEEEIIKPKIMQLLNWTDNKLWKNAKLRLTWDVGMKKPTIEDIIRLADISSKTGIPYVTVEDVRSMLSKQGFEFVSKIGEAEALQRALAQKPERREEKNFLKPEKKEKL